ncbi:hypothetical protein A6769_34710 [Nostoc punctiforme NIES-2108]|uniref:Uncharacterized protein n=1 Tax=Nostoc punctiforme NIES-2108 TaxID=1356359 RepID=A0A367R0S2_NOSPU|nr:hypothetical protein A6769_34710 [Nostoc punctiforme NIES-2108]
MSTISIFTISHNFTEVNHPTVSLAPTSEFPTPVPLVLHQPNWLLALMVLTVLTKRLHQLLVVALYFLQEWRKMDSSKSK